MQVVVDADKLMKVILSFVEEHEGEPFFIFLEVPCTLDKEKELGDGMLHRGIYRTRQITSDTVKRCLLLYEDILVNDGMIAFGVCTPKGEIGKYQYNTMIAFSNGNEPMTGAFEKNDIKEEPNLVMPWSLFSRDCP